jgi:hypothetical protein
MQRTCQTIVNKITYLVNTCCKDEILLAKWNRELQWFNTFERTKVTTYYNLPPEALEEMQWDQLSLLLSNCISSQACMYDWETRVVNVFVGTDHGDDLPEISDTYIVEVDDPLDGYDSDYREQVRLEKEQARLERAEELKYIRHERSADRHAERTGRR